jgi:hypothetical protein
MLVSSPNMNELNSRDRLAVCLSGQHGSVVWMSEPPFDRVITEHLTLSERNKRLERTMPLDHYRDRPSEPSAEPNSPPRDDLPSWWETEDGACPPPPLAWD